MELFLHIGVLTYFAPLADTLEQGGDGFLELHRYSSLQLGRHSTLAEK
jgi:hypothetical protein